MERMERGGQNGGGGSPLADMTRAKKGSYQLFFPLPVFDFEIRHFIGSSCRS